MEKTVPLSIATKNNKIPRNKFIKGCEAPVYGKLQGIIKIN